MDALNTTHRLLFQALLEIREEGRRVDNKPIYGLADVFHNVVLQLEAVAAGNSKVTYDDILTFIKQHAKSRGWDKWVDERIREMEIRSRESIASH
jgi:hypothetical protein